MARSLFKTFESIARPCSVKTKQKIRDTILISPPFLFYNGALGATGKDFGAGGMAH